MDSFKIFSQGDILSYVNVRDGEQKIGQRVQVVDQLDELQYSSAKFVLLGIPEDIGVRANYGIGGAKTAWDASIRAFLNIQSNPFLSGDDILVLGEFEIGEPKDHSIAGLRNKTNEIDALVYPVIQKIVQANKIPIVIGGGHNNALPIITGVSLALNQPLHVVNIDAHADLRETAEGRHSGNGFSYAFQHGYLNEYRVFGLHQNYVHQQLPAALENNQKVKAIYFEQLLQNGEIVKQWHDFIATMPSPCGLEIDLDGIENILSSAETPSGLALNDIRKILMSGVKDFAYLHICEGAVALADGRASTTTGKTIAYLMSDFIKALLPRTDRQL
jgi:formiminoglutamase